MLDGTRTEVMSSIIFRGRRFRTIWNRLYHFPQEQTFAQFLNYLAVQTLGPEWFKAQAKLPEYEQHVVARWREDLRRLVGTLPPVPYTEISPTGSALSYLCFAYDLYWLQMVNTLPKSLVRRLRRKEAFQGARYETLVAAAFARAGFDIELLDESEKATKHCEFVAIHKRTRAEICVEAKSRHRPGVLNEPGNFDRGGQAKADVFRLYEDAIKQAPKDRPYLIFLDTNLPLEIPGELDAYQSAPLETVPWVKEFETELRRRWASRDGSSSEAAVVMTNFAPHFATDLRRVTAGAFAVFPAPQPSTPLADGESIDDLLYCFRRYGVIPKQF